MTDQIDHAAEAQRIITEGIKSLTDDTAGVLAAPIVAALAQVHATLALVEQQKRIADMLEAVPSIRVEGGVR